MKAVFQRQRVPRNPNPAPERIPVHPMEDVVVGRDRKKGDGFVKRLARWLLENQTGVSLNVICFLFGSHQFWPWAQPFATKFFTLSYRNPHTGKYAIGYDDVYFITFVFVILTGIRAALLCRVFKPLAQYLDVCGQRERTRFAEQSYMLLCYGCFWPLGLHIYRNSPYWLNLHELWTHWPTREMDGLVKAYYLIQWSFLVQQVFICNIEQRRKDHWQIVIHHFVTIALIACSYAYHFTRVGNLILVIMDLVDLILPIGKLAKYLGYQKTCDAVFGLFVVIWLATRHVCFMMVCWSVYSDSPRALTYACFRGSADHLEGPLPLRGGWLWLFEPFFDSTGLICNNSFIMHGFLGFLLSLQVLMMVWSISIGRMVLRVLNGYAVEDTRSDDEGEEEGKGQEGQELQQVTRGRSLRRRSSFD